VRAIGYSADFNQSEEADPVNAIILAQHNLAVYPTNGGSVLLSPPGGTYFNTNLVVATASPASGYSFLYWLGDAAGTDSSINISMERDKTIQAIFGTTLSTTVAGNGQILLDPPGGVYAFGSTVRLTAVPQAGSYFGVWGNAAAGNTNPLYFTVTSAAPTVSSIFGSVPGGQASLTVSISGAGDVGVSPRANVFNLGQNLTLTAHPASGQSFLGWSGGANGTQNPLILQLNQNTTVNALFTSLPKLGIDQPGLDGLTGGGFRFTLYSAPQTVWQVLGSTNLSAWGFLGWVTNQFGEIQFTDPSGANQPMQFYRVSQ